PTCSFVIHGCSWDARFPVMCSSSDVSFSSSLNLPPAVAFNDRKQPPNNSCLQALGTFDSREESPVQTNGRGTGCCLSTRVGSQPVVNQPKRHVSSLCFLPSDTSSYLRDMDEAGRETALGLPSRLSRQIVFDPSQASEVMAHQGDLTEKTHIPYTHIFLVMYAVFEVTVAVEPQGELQ
ncbi:hypothetical protein KUCAC02_000745, partial [Chaenocephalus aceratus]